MAELLLHELPDLQRLALAYAPHGARSATLALLALDARLAGIVRRGQEPALAQIRLAWWRDTLARPVEAWPKGDALLAALSAWADPKSLVPVVDGWEILIIEELDASSVRQYAQDRGAGFAALARELGEGAAAQRSQVAGEAFALADLAANVASSEERSLVLFSPVPPVESALPHSLRSLAVLEGLARRSLRRGGARMLDGPASVLSAIRLGIAGR